jgi:tungstate transport system ATP-binding protein
MSEPLFRLEDVVKRYQGRTVLEVPYLELGCGITAIEGPNGAGKTTLLGILALLLRPDRGRLFFRGRAVRPWDERELRRRITLVAQDAYLFDTTVEANLAYGLKRRGLPRARRQEAVARALEAVGLAGLARRRARELSGGEARRVALARALVLEPEALLLDEPFTNLDQQSTAVFERVIAELPHRGTSVILVSHQRRPVERLAERVLSLREGRLVEPELRVVHSAGR